MRGAKGSALFAATTILATLSVASQADAAYDPIGGGTTRLTLDKSFRALLGEHGIRLLTRSPAKHSGPTYVLPAGGGQLDPTKAKGVVEQEGILVFQRGKRSLPLRKVELKTKREPLVAKVGGSQLKIASAVQLGIDRSGFGTEVSARGLRLTAKFATRLGKKLGLHELFEPGQPLGTIRSTVQPETVTVLDKGRATITLDSALVAKLNSMFVSINPIFPTELSPGSVMSFPIIRDGILSPDASIGTLRTAGALEFLQQGAAQVFLNEFWFEMAPRTALGEIDVEPVPTFKGKFGQVGALTMGGGAVSSEPNGRTIAISGATLALSAQTAAAFNEGFAEGKQAFGEGEPFGTLSFAAQTQ